MNSPADIRIVDERRVFVANQCEIVDGVITATGTWMQRVGANNASERHSATATYSWPVGRAHSIRWREASPE